MQQIVKRLATVAVLLACVSAEVADSAEGENAKMAAEYEAVEKVVDQWFVVLNAMLNASNPGPAYR